jgi:isocitrate dehydrogenase
MAKHDPQFAPLAKELAANEQVIAEDLIKCQGSQQDIGGYYHPCPTKTEKAMRPSATLNAIIGKHY